MEPPRSVDDADVTLQGADDDTAGPTTSRHDRPAELPRGAPIGRYVVLAAVGAGAMGSVYAAYDPKLDRRVALKLVRPHPSDDHTAAQLRLLREAQVLARLAHPNVVAVHDAGTHGDVVFIAMEFVEGRTLGAWAREAKPSWREVVAVFIAAGRGLAAAHAAGLVHRDFKPDNVMVGDDGTVRVMDFGLARAPTSTSTVDSASLGSISITRTGALVGTPAYMAPEVHLGGEVDARSDQFALCVALHEALFGERPFAGTSLPELAIAVLDGKIREAASREKVPSALRALVRRGLEVDPARRWPDVTALVAALEKIARPTARTPVLLGAAGFATAIAIGFAVMAPRTTEAQCSGAEARLVGVWDDERRAELDAAIRATGLAFAEGERQRAHAGLDAYATAWIDGHRDACLAHGRGEQSDRALDARMACLDDRQGRMRAIVDVLIDADPIAVERATTMVAGLGSPAACGDLDRVLEALPPPEDPAVAEAVAHVRHQLADARARDAAGLYAPSLELAVAARAQAQTTAYEPVLVEARVVLGTAMDRTGARADAERALVDAFMSATAIEHDDAAATAAIATLGLIGRDASRVAEIDTWTRLGEAAVTRAGDVPEVRAQLLSAIAGAQGSEGRYAEASASADRALTLRRELDLPLAVADSLVQLAAFDSKLAAFDRARARAEEALAIQRAALGDNHPALARTALSIAVPLIELGRFDDAKDYAERALAIREAALGPEHVDTAEPLRVLATLYGRSGELERGRELGARALAILERAYGKDDQRVAPAVSLMANLAYAAADLPLARGYMERTLALRERVLAPDHPDLALAYQNLAGVLYLEGDRAGAKRRYEQALAIRERALGPEHPDVAMTLGNLAIILSDEHDLDGAMALRRRELAIREKVNGPDHVETAIALAGLGEIELSRGDEASAREHLTRSLAALEAAGHEKIEIGATSFLLARALWSDPEQRGRARALALRAKEAFTGVPHLASRLADVDAFLTKASP